MSFMGPSTRGPAGPPPRPPRPWAKIQIGRHTAATEATTASRFISRGYQEWLLFFQNELQIELALRHGDVIVDGQSLAIAREGPGFFLRDLHALHFARAFH